MSGTTNSASTVLSGTNAVTLAAHTAASDVMIDTLGLQTVEIAGLQAGDTLTLLNLMTPIDEATIGDGSITLSSGGTVLVDGIAFSQLEDGKGATTNWLAGTATIAGRAYRTESVVIHSLNPYGDMLDTITGAAAASAAATAAAQAEADRAGSSLGGSISTAMTTIIAPLSLPADSDPTPSGGISLPGGGYVIGIDDGDAMEFAHGSLTVFAVSGNQAIDYTPGAYANMVVGGAQGLDVEAGPGAGRTTIVGGNGGITVHGGAVGDEKLVVGGQGALDYVGGAGNDTIFAGSASSVSLSAGNGHYIYVGGQNAVSLDVGAGDVAFLGAGGGTLTATAPGATLVGGAATTLIAGPAGGALLVASGAATLDGAGASGADTFMASAGSTISLGSGADVAVASGGLLQTGQGSATIFIAGGAGETIDVGPAGNAARSIVVDGFRQGIDHLVLTGGANAAQVTDWGGGLTGITLGDGSQVALFGVDATTLSAVS